jgi:hypothetical protein
MRESSLSEIGSKRGSNADAQRKLRPSASVDVPSMDLRIVKLITHR